MDFNAPSGSTDSNAPYVGATASTQGSKVPPRAVEEPQREIVAIINAAAALGLDAPSHSDLAQMLKAVRSGLLNRFPATGTPDAIAITPAPVYLSLVEGMRFRVKIPGTGSNTVTNPTFAVNNVSPVTMLRRDGTALTAGDLVAGRTAELEIDAAGKARIVGTVASDATGGVPFTIVPFITPGTTAWSVPAGWTRMLSLAWGPGGGASGGGNAAGGGGGFSLGIFSVTAASVIPLTVGAGGPGNNGSGTGGNGGTTSVGTLHYATGGLGGSAGPQTGGMGYGGLLNLPGGRGEDLESANYYAMGGMAPFGGIGFYQGAMAFGGGGSATASSAVIGASGTDGGAGAILLIPVR